jgi:hypothetical protein
MIRMIANYRVPKLGATAGAWGALITGRALSVVARKGFTPEEFDFPANRDWATVRIAQP